VSDGELPPDPFLDESRPFSSSLDWARLLRESLTSVESLDALLAALDGLSADEMRLMLFEAGLESLDQRCRGDGEE
jgi:hypothetical protein